MVAGLFGGKFEVSCRSAAKQLRTQRLTTGIRKQKNAGHERRWVIIAANWLLRGCFLATQKLLRFGIFELNLATEELRKDGVQFKLAPQPFRILALLASQAGQIVSREEIRQQIWGGETYVDFEHGMNQCIKQIRTVLGDNPDNPVYVETIPRKGYRFLAEVTIKTFASQPAVVESESGLHSILPAAVGIAPVAQAAPADDKVLSPAGVGIQGAAVLAAPAAAAAAPAPAKALVPETIGHRSWLRVALVTLVFVALIAGIFYWHSQRASALTEKDTVVLADFLNTTGDALFDSALRQSLTFDLEGSPFINILSEERVNEQLRYMGQPSNARLTPEVTRQVCQRSGSKAIIVGSISALGSHYLIGLEAIDCASGESLGREQEEADSREHITKALSKAASNMRRKLGESLASVQKFNKPAEDATTPSMEALVAFNQGRLAQITGQGDPIFYFKRALELDPNFGVAYAALAAMYGDAGQMSLALQYYNKAYELRDRVSPQERFYIEGNYASISGELSKSAQIYTAWAQSYPGNYKPHLNLSDIYSRTGQYEKAVADALEALQLSPNNVLAYTDLIKNYIALDRLDMAKSYFEQAQARKLDYPFLRYYRYLIGFLRNDAAAMQQQFDWAMGKPGAEDLLLSAQSDTEAFYGRMGKAGDLSQRAVQSAKRADTPETAASWKANAALREAEVGHAAQARQQALEALALAPGQDVQVVAALALARAGDLAMASKIADQLDQQYPHDTMMQGFSLPIIRAAIQLSNSNPAKAIDALQEATPYEYGGQSIGYLYPAYLRGEAYLKAGQGQQAAAEYGKVIGHPGIMLNFVTGALARLQLARAQTMTGDQGAARKSYQDFLSLWKEADADVPILQAGKAEYQRLN